MLSKLKEWTLVSSPQKDFVVQVRFEWSFEREVAVSVGKGQCGSGQGQAAAFLKLWSWQWLEMRREERAVGKGPDAMGLSLYIGWVEGKIPMRIFCISSGGSQCVEEGREAWKVDWGSIRRGLGVGGWVFATSEGFSEHRSALGFRKLNSDSSIWTFWVGLGWGGSKVESRHPYNFMTLLPWQNNWA